MLIRKINNWRVGREAMQRIANPYTSVQFRDAPPVINVTRMVEFGRHKGLKIPRPYGYAGSSPAPGTIQLIFGLTIIKLVFSKIFINFLIY